MSAIFLDDLAKTISQRKEEAADTSYTASLLQKGIKKCSEKFGEEAFELAIAAVSEDDDALKGEAADVIYHLMVILAARDIALDDVITILKARTSQSGHAEKASRSS